VNVIEMAVQMKTALSNGKAAGFDNEADFIPFETSDDELASSRPGSRQSLNEPLPAQPLNNLRETNGETRKRKRKDIESSPERGPPKQRQRIDVNPWQDDIDDYASLKETSRMYLLVLLTFLPLGYTRKFKISQIGFLLRQRKLS
jgi:hypothetical protein